MLNSYISKTNRAKSINSFAKLSIYIKKIRIEKRLEMIIYNNKGRILILNFKKEKKIWNNRIYETSKEIYLNYFSQELLMKYKKIFLIGLNILKWTTFSYHNYFKIFLFFRPSPIDFRQVDHYSMHQKWIVVHTGQMSINRTKKTKQATGHRPKNKSHKYPINTKDSRPVEAKNLSACHCNLYTMDLGENDMMDRLAKSRRKTNQTAKTNTHIKTKTSQHPPLSKHI